MGTLTGRQWLWLTYEYFKVNAEDRKLTDISTLQSISLRDGNLQQFKFLWDQAVELMHERPAPQLLLQYFLLNMDFLQQTHEFYLELMLWKRRPDTEKSYETLASTVDLFLQAKVEQKNRRAHIGDAMPGLIPAKQAWKGDGKGKGKNGGQGGDGKPQGPCFDWAKRGECSKGKANCPYTHYPADRGAGIKKGDSKGKGKSKGKNDKSGKGKGNQSDPPRAAATRRHEQTRKVVPRRSRS